LGICEDGFCFGLGISEEGRAEIGLAGPEDDDPKTLPWPLNLPEDEDEKGLLTFFMNPLTLSFTSSISIYAQKKISLETKLGLMIEEN
jgi:hypothetical protein